jgi:hypothetical protein
VGVEHLGRFINWAATIRVTVRKKIQMKSPERPQKNETQIELQNL